MDIDQVMYRSDGTRFRRVDTPAVAKYSGDGHDHWHVQGVVTYEAWQLADPQNARRGAKTGFCFFDTTPWRALAARTPDSRPTTSRSGAARTPSMTNRVGVSVGWGDRYPWNFAYQWIDITGLPGGVYRVRATVDIQNFYRRGGRARQLRLDGGPHPRTGSGNSLEVLRNGKSCGEAAVAAVDAFPGGETFDPSRTVTIEPGVHVGWTFNSQGTRLNRLWRDLAHAHGRDGQRARYPARAGGDWLYMDSGPFAGYWLKQGDGVAAWSP